MAEDKGMLVSFTEVAAEFDSEHNEWFNREHLDERALATPGFFRARRYEAVSASIRYCATYETESWRTLGSPEYLKRVGHQSDWSNRVIKRLDKFHRLTTRLTIDLMHGIGGAVATVRLPPETGAQIKLRDWLRSTLADLVKQPGLIGACLGENMLDAANATGDQARALGGRLAKADRLE
ncbi:MAG: hypothetical protein EXQ85_10060 [Alphaproteobacteria bacterium]|nr:hypothetical protein [Alphaproteobacteria bacterium]